jgi:hypothetical protein
VSQFRPHPHLSLLSPVLSKTKRSILLFGSQRPFALLPYVLLVLLGGGCERRESTIIDTQGQTPLLAQVIVSPSSINSDTINVGSSRKPEDTLSLSTTITAHVDQMAGNPISAVRFSLKNPDNNEAISQGALLDDGNGADQRRNDGIYSGKAEFQIERVVIGVFQVEVTAEGSNGFQSNTVIAPLTVYRGNHPPVISAIQAPDTVHLGSQDQLLVLHVSADDPDGLADLARVILNSYLPDGSPSKQNPIPMYDDGSPDHGDTIAGDGIFSLIIQLSYTTPTGTYKFVFQAFDRSNVGSSTIVHTVTVLQ